MPFQGLILIGQVVPKLWPFIYQTNDRTRSYDITIVTILYLFFARTTTYVWARTYGHARAKEWPVWLLFLARGLKVFFVFFARTATHVRACISNINENNNNNNNNNTSVIYVYKTVVMSVLARCSHHRSFTPHTPFPVNFS